MPLPEDEASWDELDVMFATTSGDVRRNELSDFVDVNAQRQDRDEARARATAIVGVEICTGSDDVLLTTRSGQCIRFPVTDVRVFEGRELDRRARHQRSATATRVISMAILRHFEATPAERARLSQDDAAPCAARARPEEASVGGRRRGDEETSAGDEPASCRRSATPR